MNDPARSPVDGEVLWTPPPDARERSELGRYLRWLEEHRGLRFGSYDELWRWSTDDLDAFWSSIWEFFRVKAHAPYERVLGRRELPGAEWFPGALLNYAEHALGEEADLDTVAVYGRSQTRPPLDVTFGDLREQVARARAGLERLGIREGDRVVAYLPNIPETVACFLATASLGAVWASCAPEFGVRAVVDRFAQIEPKALLTISGYRYGEKEIDRRAEAAAIAERLPGLEHLIHVPYGGFDEPPPGTSTGFAELLAEPGELRFASVPFAHPLFVLFSSGTTGLPKAIVHCHGGILLEHLKLLGLLWDLHRGDRLFWPSTTAWMMWNALVSALLHKCAIVTFDGNQSHPDLAETWRIAADTKTTMFGANPAVINAWRKAGLEPAREFDLSSLREIGTAGSPLPADAYRWVYEQFPPELLLTNGTGGTDVCCGFTSSSYLTPVWAGEMSVRCLGVAAEAFDLDGNPVVGELGELVITKPMPSMPVAFWNDPDGSRYRSSYFDMYPGVWRQGDWVLFTERGSSIVTGRSDATLNRGGVRLGTGDFYSVLEELPELAEALVVHLEDPEGGMGDLLLFVAPAPGHDVDDALRAKIAGALRANLSPRHVPDQIVGVPSIPKTLTGKKLELPIKRILKGAAVEQVASRDSLPDPDALEPFVEFARARPGSL